jgi:hypothetical protein
MSKHDSNVAYIDRKMNTYGTSRNMAKNRFESMEFDLTKPPHKLKLYKKHKHDLDKEFVWSYTRPPRGKA